MSKKSETLYPKNFRVEPEAAYAEIMKYMKECFPEQKGYNIIVSDFSMYGIYASVEMTVQHKLANFLLTFSNQEVGFVHGMIMPLFSSENELIEEIKDIGDVDFVVSIKQLNRHVLVLTDVTGLIPSHTTNYDGKGNTTTYFFHFIDQQQIHCDLSEMIAAIQAFCELHVVLPLLWDIETDPEGHEMPIDFNKSYDFGAHVPDNILDYVPGVSLWITPENCDEVIAKYKTDKSTV